MTDILAVELTADEARELTAEIRRDLANFLPDFLPKVERAHRGRADRALGYPSWDAYSADVLGGVKIPVADRPAAAAQLRNAGMSTRAIGSALGVSQPTVRRDLRATESFDSVAKVTSLDGKQRPATQPKTEPTPALDFTPLDRQLDAEMEGTDQRFRRNFSAAVAKADDIWQFDADRIAEAYAGDYEQAIRPFLDEMIRWCDGVHAARRQASGLRVVGGAR